MRLPADATLIVVGDAPEGAPGEKVAALLAAWRAEGLPIVHIGWSLEEPAPGEAAIAAFDAAGLERALDAIGATTLTLCGEARALTEAARTGAALGCHVFVVGDACWDVGEAPTPELATDARIVSAAAATAAAALARLRQRREAARQARS